jgi:hypothetical protein
MATGSGAWSDGWGLANGPSSANGELEFFINGYASHLRQFPHLNDNTSWVAVSAVFNSSTQMDIYNSNDSTGENTFGSSPPASISYGIGGTYQLVIGGYTNSGGSGAATPAPAMDIAEVIVCGAALGSTDRATLQTYVNGRYGL